MEAIDLFHAPALLSLGVNPPVPEGWKTDEAQSHSGRCEEEGKSFGPCRESNPGHPVALSLYRPSYPGPVCGRDNVRLYAMRHAANQTTPSAALSGGAHSCLCRPPRPPGAKTISWLTATSASVTGWSETWLRFRPVM
jgi:hypothetical protein